jgi:transcriptional regulator with XRE-family HTH domain
MSFSELLKSKIGEAALPDVAAAIGVALPGLRRAISGRSLPNARSLAKYAAFLGITEDEAKALVASARVTAPVKARSGKGRKAKAAAAEGGEAAPKAGRRGGRKGKAPKGGDLSASLGLIADAIAKAEAILADPLVNTLYSLTGAKRKAAEAILASVI